MGQKIPWNTIHHRIEKLCEVYIHMIYYRKLYDAYVHVIRHKVEKILQHIHSQYKNVMHKFTSSTIE